nr:hypothetical protein [Bacillota bacterium]
MWPDLVDLFASVGFPAAVAVYLLVRLDGRVARLNVELERLSPVVQDLVHAVTRVQHNLTREADGLEAHRGAPHRPTGASCPGGRRGCPHRTGASFHPFDPKGGPRRRRSC